METSFSVSFSLIIFQLTMISIDQQYYFSPVLLFPPSFSLRQNTQTGGINAPTNE